MDGEYWVAVGAYMIFFINILLVLIVFAKQVIRHKNESVNRNYLSKFSADNDLHMYDDARPALFFNKGNLKEGVLLLHGFSSSTEEFEYLLKEAEQLVQEGVIHEKEDIYYLTFEELREVVAHLLSFW